MSAFRVGKPRFKVGLLAPMAMGGGAPTVPWNRVWYEDPPGVTAGPVAGEYTITKTGLWLVAFNIQRAAGGAAYLLSLQFQVNGVNQLVTNAPATTEAIALSLSGLEELQAGDVVRLRGNFTTTAIGPKTINTLSFLALTRVGPDRWT